ncbi:MAG: hypothetical protein KIT27_03495 [Legionellales bacterium]|nr:hypothetical protein [Legionellales bacterium]
MPSNEIFALSEKLLLELQSDYCALFPEIKQQLIRQLRFILTSSAQTLSTEERLRDLYHLLLKFEAELRNVSQIEGLLESLLLQLSPSMRSSFSPKPTPFGGGRGKNEES